jgi:hypothetical protein
MRREKSTYDETEGSQLVFPTEISIQVTRSGQRLTGIVRNKYYGYDCSKD